MQSIFILLQEKDNDSHDSGNIDDILFLQRKLIDLAAENTELRDEIDRLSFLLTQRSNRERFGKILIDVEPLLEILNFEKYIAEQSQVYLVYYDDRFLRVVPNYEFSRQTFEISEKEEKKQEKKDTFPQFDSIV